MKQRMVWSIFVLLVFGLVACNQPPTPTPNPNQPRITFTTNPTPPTTGQAELIVQLTDGRDQPIPNATVTISYRMTSMNMGITSNTATSVGNGKYQAQTSFAHAGRTKFTIQVDTPGLPQSILETELDVQ